MLLRGRSKDRNRKVTPPGPVCMSNEQFAEYLADLRTNRVARPSGARPQPLGNRDASDKRASISSRKDEPEDSLSADATPRCASALSQRRAHSSLSTYPSITSRTDRSSIHQSSGQVKDLSPKLPDTPLRPSDVVPTSTYIERGQRWMEKEEAVALRSALEDMDLKKQDNEEARIQAAAQEEASELVYQHQHPGAAIDPNVPYRYKDHLRKNSYQHARSQSVGRYGGLGSPTGLARDMPPRSFSGGSNSSDGILSPRSRVSSGSSDDAVAVRKVRTTAERRNSLDQQRDTRVLSANQKFNGGIGMGGVPSSSRRRSSAKRNISGETTGTFTGEQIWEEPEHESEDRGRSQTARDMPAPLRIKPRNPLNRVQFTQDMTPKSISTAPEPIKKQSIVEIHRNTPSQSRNPAYTANLPTSTKPSSSDAAKSEEASQATMKDGLEIRSDEIRQATSMRLKDRSEKLPIPTFVSDVPGRPIVSFNADWRPKEADIKPEEKKDRRRSPFDRRSWQTQKQSSPAGPNPKAVTTPIPKIKLPDAASSVNNATSPSLPRLTMSTSTVSVPTINLPSEPSRAHTTPSIPTINFLDETPASRVAPSVPTINFPSQPSISISAPTVLTINIQPSNPPSTRPLPDPRTVTGRPTPRHHATAPVSRGHWSAAAPVGNRATATCHQCQLPIEGRVVSIRGTPERFHPQCFICFCCGTSLEALEISPEPPANRAARLDRIKRRASGEELPEIDGQTMAEDGDERLRFYCHLDWHENYAPRCKHCKTPIIGEHTVALGEHWHYGHFFCAECGDPFEKGMSHIEKDGYAWCLNCQTKRTERQAPKCKKCKKAVIGQYVQALGGEWHDCCFRCATCKGGFDDGQIFPKEVGQDIVVLCTGCMERELKA